MEIDAQQILILIVLVCAVSFCRNERSSGATEETTDEGGPSITEDVVGNGPGDVSNQILDERADRLENYSQAGWDNHDNVTQINILEQTELNIIFTGSVARKSYETLSFVTGSFVRPALAIFGILGNFAAIMVLRKRQLGEGINTYLAALSITDIGYTTMVLVLTPQTIIANFNPTLANEITAITFTPSLYLNPLFSRCSTLFIVILSIERFVAVRFPFFANRFILSKHQKITVAILYTFLGIIELPRFFQFRAISVVDQKTNDSYLFIQPTDFSKSTTFYQYYNIVMRISLRVIPLATVLILNILTILSLQISRKQRKAIVNTSTAQSKNSSKITHLLLTITAIFIVCVTPRTLNFLIAIYSSVWGLGKKEHYAYLSVNSLTIVAEVFNSSVNFVVYMFMSKSFRETFQEIFSIHRKRAL